MVKKLKLYTSLPKGLRAIEASPSSTAKLPSQTFFFLLSFVGEVFLIKGGMVVSTEEAFSMLVINSSGVLYPCNYLSMARKFWLQFTVEFWIPFCNFLLLSINFEVGTMYVFQGSPWPRLGV